MPQINVTVDDLVAGAVDRIASAKGVRQRAQGGSLLRARKAPSLIPA
jgi:hypothetical protein